MQEEVNRDEKEVQVRIGFDWSGCLAPRENTIRYVLPETGLLGRGFIVAMALKQECAVRRFDQDNGVSWAFFA